MLAQPRMNFPTTAIRQFVDDHQLSETTWLDRTELIDQEPSVRTHKRQPRFPSRTPNETDAFCVATNGLQGVGQPTSQDGALLATGPPRLTPRRMNRQLPIPPDD